MARYVIIKNNVIINAVDWDGGASWRPPADCIAVLHATAGIGWNWNNGVPTNPTPPPPLPPLPPPIDLSNIDNLEKSLKAAVSAAAIMSGSTPAQAKAAFKQAWDQLSGAQTSSIKLF